MKDLKCRGLPSKMGIVTGGRRDILCCIKSISVILLCFLITSARASTGSFGGICGGLCSVLNLGDDGWGMLSVYIFTGDFFVLATVLKGFCTIAGGKNSVVAVTKLLDVL